MACGLRPRPSGGGARNLGGNICGSLLPGVGNRASTESWNELGYWALPRDRSAGLQLSACVQEKLCVLLRFLYKNKFTLTPHRRASTHKHEYVRPRAHHAAFPARRARPLIIN
eukprot:scaffold933_cov112-Isochrysis_galbana.AAC.1